MVESLIDKITKSKNKCQKKYSSNIIGMAIFYNEDILTDDSLYFHLTRNMLCQ